MNESKNGRMGKKVNDGAYETMIARITGNKYRISSLWVIPKEEWQVDNLLRLYHVTFLSANHPKRNGSRTETACAGW